MKINQIAEISFALILFEFATAIIWQALELIVYGEIQPRVVDDLMGLVFLYGMVEAYRMGKRHGKEDT
ncbi:hypothetical protein H8S45_15915 [Agathobaculum sp. NSJ-28]|uniref:Uncharacterized protein n=1 Tax=Agathobaculum faecis TaxID=2763013 RepID=A0A923LZM4_9FIRM|nr:hypothetical protein [Agathobaculum faecis]MBC5726922.1 hypothetical protein [Agathobaculum faecis]